MNREDFARMHCQKGGPGDYDVCWYGIDHCSCYCEMCKEAYRLEDIEVCRREVENLSNEAKEWYKAEIIKEYMKDKKTNE